MTAPAQVVVVAAPLALSVVSIAYTLLACILVARFARASRTGADRGDDALPAATVLKPVCGLDPGMAANLASFCDQDHPRFQVLFGVASADDPAIPVIRAVLDERPGRDLALVVDERVIGANRKVSNLANLYRHAKHGILVVADSDMRVGPDYLRAVTAAFHAPEVGAATCPYTARATGGRASTLAAMFINGWFLPSVLVRSSLGPIDFCLGATMAVRREALEAYGGFDALAPYLADDYMFGKLVAKQGLQIRLVPYVVENAVREPGLRGLWLHELRWARTMRTVAPVGYAFTFVTDAVPLSLLSAAALLAAGAPAIGAVAVVAAALAARSLLLRRVSGAFGLGRAPSPPWILVRDCLTLGVRVASFLGRSVQWRHENLSVDPEGHLHSRSDAPAGPDDGGPLDHAPGASFDR